MRRLSLTTVPVLTVLALAAAAAPAAAQSPVCLGDPTAAGVVPAPGPLLRFGINPAGEAGALGIKVPPVPERPEKTHLALAALRPPGAPFVIRLNRFFWSLGEPGIERFLTEAKRFTDRGYLVELQLRYHPAKAQEGDIAAWTGFVREIVRRFGPNRRIVGLQVTNEVNFAVSPDSSDGAFTGARDALVQGVIAASDEARRHGYRQLEVGFNWFYRTDPATEKAFWEHLRDRGGRRFAAAVDWVGLDAYPGTFFPPAEAPSGYRDGMVAALSALRKCFMPIPGLGAAVPIHVEENGWPTGPGRSEATQADALEAMVRAVHDFRGTYNVSDYRWFDLRDHATSSANFQHHYGLLRDDYAPKPAFERFRRLLAELARRDPPAHPKPRVALRLGYHSGRRGLLGCARTRVRATITGADARRVRRVDFFIGRRRAASDPSAPFERVLRLEVRRRAVVVRARVRLRDATATTLVRRLRAC